MAEEDTLLKSVISCWMVPVHLSGSESRSLEACMVAETLELSCISSELEEFWWNLVIFVRLWCEVFDPAEFR